MARVNFVTRSAKGRIRNVSRKPKLGEASFRSLFPDAVPAGPMPGNATDLLSLVHVTDVLGQKLKSTGGRPALEAADETPMRVSLMAGDRLKVEAITSQICGHGKLRPSPAQVVAVLCHLALQRISGNEIRQISRRLKAG